MCQLLGVSVSEPISLRLSWAQFAQRGSEQWGNADGWGVAYFSNRDVLLLREPAPAAESPMVRFLEHCAPPSAQIISHVRRASVGVQCLENTQPFIRRLAGRAHVFAHNGFVADTNPAVEEIFLSPLGDTDSEWLFGLLLSRLVPLWRRGAPPSLEARVGIIQEFARDLRPRGALNFLYCDGETLFAHGHRHTVPGEAISDDPGLYVLQRDGRSGEDPIVPCAGLECDGAVGPHALIASVPLDDQTWIPLRPGEVACFEGGQRVR